MKRNSTTPVEVASRSDVLILVLLFSFYGFSFVHFFPNCLVIICVSSLNSSSIFFIMFTEWFKSRCYFRLSVIVV